VLEAPHSRYPVGQGSLDHLDGVVHVRDLLAGARRSTGTTAGEVARPVLAVPETKDLGAVLRELRERKEQLAVVLNEYGAVAGIVTVEDILEELVGEIEDELDDEDGECGIYTLADGSQRVAGDTDIAAVNEAFGAMLPTDEFDTIGGLLAHEFGRVPRRGEAVTVDDLVFSVMLARGGAVRWFKVIRAPESAPEPDGA